MAVNPLFVFVGLSVTTVGGIVAVVQQNKAPPKPVAAVVQPAPLTPTRPKAKPAVVPAPPSPLAALPKAPKAKPAVQKLASLEPKQKIAKKITKPKPTVVAGPVVPTFDVVRVEKDGGAVVVGKAEPGAKMVLKLNNKVIGETTANGIGDWVFVPDQLVPQGSNELIVEATGKNKKVVRSKQSIFIAIPKGAEEKPLIVVANPDAPTRVLQQPEAKPEPVKIAAPAPSPVKVKKAAAPKPVPVIKEPAKKIASLPKPVETPKPEVKVEQPKPAKPIKKTRLTFGTVDYNDNGEIVFTGKAAAGATVRLYVDNVFVGDAVVGTNGGWVFRGKEQIKPGVHELRADQVDKTGRVAQRTGVPFVRANPKKVAALLKTRTKPAPKVVQQKNPAVVVIKTATKSLAKPAAKPIAKVVSQPSVQPPAPRKVAKVEVAPQPPKATVVAKPKKQVAAPIPTPVPVPTPLLATSPVSKPIVVPVATPEVTPTQPKLVSHVVIQPGNNLWNISRVIYGKGVAYTTIYQANHDQIKNPDQIYPGQIFTTPGTTSTGSIGPDQREPLNQPTGDQLAGDKTVQN